MATTTTIGGDGTLFLDEDKTLYLEVLDVDLVPVNIATWTMLFDVRAKDNSEAPALISKTPVVIGTYSATRASNTQRARVILTDDDLSSSIFKGSNLEVGAKTYRHSWKRTDSGSETVITRGDFSPEKATAA